MSEPSSGAERFVESWKRLEFFLKESYREAHGVAMPRDTEALWWARQAGILSQDSFNFLTKCRHARNAYSHVIFDDYDGPVAVPPLPVTHRLERLVGALTNPPKVTAVSVRATTCDAYTPILDALRVMKKQDFSQLPFRSPGVGWMLVTREQVSRWVEGSAESDAACLLDLSRPVSDLPELAGVGPVIPRTVNRSTLLAEAVEELSNSFQIPDRDRGGYPLILVVGESESTPDVLAAEDLPRAYKMLGR